ncbi:GNAT family N-acetyltransferase [Roseovarius pacificus]|uniref:GNAT family N-acetyltransferase n=1 Tax=Roseovarius pacificus TaxID=337701 RepID=UPI002A18C936|nr:GNAT family N-acetyltransferase [Roseovarius pacificus]
MRQAGNDRYLSLECLETPAHEQNWREDWDAFVQQTGAEVYFLTGWQAAWWQHYGPDLSGSRKPVSYILRDGPQIIGILPFCIETVWAGIWPVRFARLAGVDPNFAVMTLPIVAGKEDAVLRSVTDHLTQQMRCAAISLSPLSDRSPQLASIRAMAANGATASVLRDRSDRGHTLMDLPDSRDGFMAALSKSRRREVRRDIKRLTQDAPLRNISSDPDTLDIMMDRFIELHTRQWQAVGKGGHFSDWWPAAAFYRTLLHRLAPDNRAAIDEQWQGDTLLSSQLRYTLGDKAYWWLNARAIDPRFEKVGLGRVGLVERVGDLIDAGIGLVEAGAGEYEYKLSYGGELVPVHALVLAGRGPVARLRVQALLLWADAIHLFYYRLWFLKIRPRLGTRPRALWAIWIRTRL